MVYITPVVALVDGVLHQEDGIDYGDCMSPLSPSLIPTLPPVLSDIAK